MDFTQAISLKIAEYERSRAQGPQDFDAWDHAALDYLEAIKAQLDQGVEPSEIYQRLKDELPTLQERVEGEEAVPTFDWYDDHYYLKIYSGQLQACKSALELFETCKTR